MNDLSSGVDEKGRLRLPTDFRQTIEAHPEWFLDDDEEALQVRPDAGTDQLVEAESKGRTLKNKEVRVVLEQGKIEVITEEEFERRLSLGDFTSA